MLYTEPNGLRGENCPSSAKSINAHRYVQDFNAEDLKKSLLPSHEMRIPIEELIATAEAAFEFIRGSDLDQSTKDAFYQLEKQFDFYKNLIKL